MPGVVYTFRGWAASWGTDGFGEGDVSPALPQIAINGKAVTSAQLPAVDGQWVPITDTWIATSGHATLTLTDLNTDIAGNDSAYDDFSFTPLASIHGNVRSAIVSKNHLGHIEPVAGATVFLDINSNGVLDLDEPTAVTSKSGAYVFAGLTGGTYRVQQESAFTSDVPAPHLLVSVPAGKQVMRENLLDIFTSATAIGTVGIHPAVS